MSTVSEAHLNSLNATAIKAINVLFSYSFQATKDLKKEKNPPILGPYLTLIALRNKQVQMNIFLAMDTKTAKAMLSETLTLAGGDTNQELELTQSSLGELANTIACDLATQKLFLDAYGTLLPTNPLIWMIDKVRPDFHEVAGLTGKISTGNFQIATHCSLMPFASGSTEHSTWHATKSLAICDPHQR